MIDSIEMLLGSATTLAVAGLVQHFRGDKKSVMRFSIGTVLVLGLAIFLKLEA